MADDALKEFRTHRSWPPVAIQAEQVPSIVTASAP
jgi:hypothetical protein